MHLKDDMDSQDQNENDFLSELSPTLFDQKQSADDTPPEGYFDEFPDRLMVRIEKESNKSVHHRFPSYINFRTLSIAAGFALILALIPYFKTVFQNDKNSTGMISTTDNSLNKIDSEVLANYIDTEDLYATAELENAVISLPQPETDSDVIIDYLMDEGVSDQLFLESTNTDEL